MLMNSTKLLMANIMMIGVIMTICSNSWISMWMGLEISMLSFIPLMNNNNKMSSESMIKYFIIQSLASTMFLLSVVIMLIGVNMINEMIMTMAMLIKLGSAPFHNWVVMIIEPMNYINVNILLTIMKAPPLYILYQINYNLLSIPIMLGMIISSIMCLNQSSIKKIIGYSSIYNVSLMLITISSFNLTMMFLIIYSISLMLLLYLLSMLKINFIKQISFNEFNTWIKINLWINMLSMSGFPPLIGFLTKILVIQTLIFFKEIVVLVILLLTSLIVMLFYMRLSFTSMILMSTSVKWMKNSTNLNLSFMLINLLFTPMMLTLSMML